MRLSKAFILAIAVAAAISCIAKAQNGNVQPLKVTISTTREEVRVGEEVRIHVVLANVSEQVISVLRSPNQEQAEEHYIVRVYDKSGKDATETKYGHAAKSYRFGGSEIVKPLAPGETMAEDTILSKQFNLATPGEYQIQLSRPVSEDPKDGIVQSNKLTITVLPPDPPADEQK